MLAGGMPPQGPLAPPYPPELPIDEQGRGDLPLCLTTGSHWQEVEWVGDRTAPALAVCGGPSSLQLGPSDRVDQQVPDTTGAVPCRVLPGMWGPTLQPALFILRQTR